MGEVWKARDTRLDRSVAIKVLPADIAGSSQLRLRFEREAKTISQLHHPNICSLFDVGENYLVMELIDGESLADRLQRGAMPLAEVLKYGAQIAEALDRAHRAGVVHRDLKPGNIMITRGGAKLLDFGLAKAERFDVGAEGATEHKPLTQEGTILGTFQYMAPEQLEGSEADPRTDIFALGAVLYEMATGKRAFHGKTKTSLIAAIVAAQPTPVSELQPLTPPALEHVIVKCLSKDPEDRWQSAHDVAEELKWIAGAGSQASGSAAASKRKRTSERAAWILLWLATIAVAAWLLQRSRTVPEIVEASMDLEGSNGLSPFSGPPALSPDGRSVAYAASADQMHRVLWVRTLDRSLPRQLPGTRGAISPFWSPDGRFIGFVTPRGIKKVAVNSGEVETIADLPAGSASWSRDGIILYSGPALTPLHRIPSSGGEPVPVLTPQSIGANAILFPWFLPDGNRFLFMAAGGEVDKRKQAGIWIASLDGKEKPRFLVRSNANAVYVEPGYLLYAMDGALRAERFDPREGRLHGEAVTIAPVQSYMTNFAAHFSASSAGVLVYERPGNIHLSEILLKNRKGEVIRKIAGPGNYWGPHLTQDGGRIVLDSSDDRGSGDLWIFGTAGDSSTRVSFDERNETSPVWSPDGTAIAYALVSRDGTMASVYQKRQAGEPEEVFEIAGTVESPTDWSADGRHLAVALYGTRAGGDIRVWSFAEQKLIDVAVREEAESAAVFSPDGKWIAYQANPGGVYDIYVQPFPPTGAKYQVSTDGGIAPRWRRDGEIAYIDRDNVLQAVKVQTTPSFHAGSRTPLFPFNPRDTTFTQYDIAPDGNFVVNAEVRQEPRPLILVMNWHRRLGR